jgi:hypothetical protein
MKLSFVVAMLISSLALALPASVKMEKHKVIYKRNRIGKVNTTG